MRARTIAAAKRPPQPSEQLAFSWCAILRSRRRFMKKEEITTAPRFTSADLESFPDDGKRYEIIDGELYVSKQPHFYHQRVCSRILLKLEQWSQQSGDGEAVIFEDAGEGSGGEAGFVGEEVVIALLDFDVVAVEDVADEDG